MDSIIQVLGIMAFMGGFLFLAMGLSIANSIEAKESKLASNIMTGIMILAILSFLIGMFGLIVIGIFK